MPQQFRSTQKSRTARRGSVYLLVLGMGALLTVVGLAVATSGRIAARNTAAERNLAESATLAASAIDLAVSTINDDSTWRKTYGCDEWNPNFQIGHGELSWKQVDEIDNDTANDPGQPVRLVGMASVGDTARQFSMLAAATGDQPLPVLATTLHSETSINVTSAIISSGGPISCDGTLTNGSTINASVEANAITNTGSIVGFVTQPSPNKTVPNAASLASYASSATQISYFSIPSGDIDSTIVSRSSNPYGIANAGGIYFIRVPTGRRLRIRDSIIQATLLIELQGTAQLQVSDLVAWEPPATGMPSMIAVGSSSSTVTVAQTTGTVNVPLMGENLLGIVVVVGTRATAPSELHGLFHLVGGASTTFQQSPRIIGTWICDGPISVASKTELIADPSLLTNPPPGYTYLDATVKAVPSTFRWDER